MEQRWHGPPKPRTLQDQVTRILGILCIIGGIVGSVLTNFHIGPAVIFGFGVMFVIFESWEYNLFKR